MTEELKNIENTDSVENTEVVENAELVEGVSNEVVEKSGNDKHWYVLRVMGGKEKKQFLLLKRK